MFLDVFPVGPFQANCAICACERTREAAVIDPGGDASIILDRVRKNRLNVKAILHTHAHIDHVGATAAIHDATSAQVALHRADEPLYTGAPMQGRLFGIALGGRMPPIDRFIEDGDSIAVGDDLIFEVIHTPGHSPGSVCFRISTSEKLVFSGDTLFCLGVGRTDLWGGSFDTLVRSIRERLFTLDPETIVVPGHGPETTIGDERAHNPFLNG